MSFRINTNSLAMSSLRNLGNTNVDMNRSMTRLTTGLRINSAADDPAGLIVSENFRAQISGIDQAIRNNQDASNYAKTAESALDEVTKLLRDARALSVASGNGATLTDSQRQANQQQLNSIMESVNRISETTSYGNKKLLDGSSGITAGSTSANYGSMSFSGSFNSKAVTANSAVTVQVTTAAERASVAGTVLYTLATDNMAAGSFTLNGVSFNVSASDTIGDVLGRVNAASAQTGVNAVWNEAGGAVTFRSAEFGSAAKVQLIDSDNLFGSADQASDTGVDAAATVSVDTNGATAGGVESVSFASGKGLTLRDNSGNAINLNEAGNATGAAAAVGQIFTGASTFQVGANADERATLSIGNFRSNSLGAGAVASTTFADVNLLSDSASTDALKVIDKAIEQVSEARGRIGNFVRNTLETNVRSLGVQKENLAASESTIRDVDIAEETTKYTKLQILQQTGISMLAQANSAPQAVLSLLR